MIKPYTILLYAIKHGNIGFFQYVVEEIILILLALAAKKPKYARAMMRPVYLFDIRASDPQLQKAYLANLLVHPHILLHTFYEIDLLLEHQNREFKCF